MEAGSLCDRLRAFHCTVDDGSHYKVVRLNNVSAVDRRACIQIWTNQDLQSNELIELPGPILALSLRILSYLKRKAVLHGEQLSIKDYSPSSLLHTWFSVVERELGYSKVRFTLQHLLSSRWGLDTEGLLSLNRHSEFGKFRSMLLAHRNSTQTTLLGDHLLAGTSSATLIDYYWLDRFYSACLIPIGMLCERHSPPAGSGRLHCLENRVIREVIQSRYLSPEQKIASHVNLATWWTKEWLASASFTPLVIMWRCIHELSWQLSNARQSTRLRGLCWFNPLWIAGILQVSRELRGRKCAPVQRLFMEISTSLYFLYADKWETMISERLTQGPTLHDKISSSVDRHTTLTLKLIEEDVQLCNLMKTLAIWKNQLKRDPVLLTGVLYVSLHEIFGESEAADTSSANEEEEVETGVVASSRKAVAAKDHSSDLCGLVKRIKMGSRSLLIRPLNYQIDINTSTAGLISELLTSSMRYTNITYAQIVEQLHAVAYSPDKTRLAAGVLNTRDQITRIDVWCLSTKTVVWSQIISLESMNKVEQLYWVTNGALLVVQHPSQTITLWPLSVPTNYYQLSEPRVGAHDCVAVRIVETELPELSFVFILDLGASRLKVWRWHSGMIEPVFGSITLGNPGSTTASHSPPIGYRRQSLPLMVKTSVDTLFTAVMKAGSIFLLCAHRNEAAAKIISLKVTGPKLDLNLAKPNNQKVLKCPRAGARVIALEAIRHGPMVLASRAPSMELPNEPIVGCLDLFEPTTGAHLDHLEGGPNAFIFVDTPTLEGGLLSRPVPPSLCLCSDQDGVNLLGIPVNTELSGCEAVALEVVHWNLVTRVCRVIQTRDLFPHILTWTGTIPIPTSVAFKDMGELSACFGNDQWRNYRIWHCDPSTLSLSRSVSEMKSKQLLDNPLVDANRPSELLYLYRNSEREVYLCSMVKNKCAESEQIPDWCTTTTHQLKPDSEAVWSLADRFIMQGRRLLVLSKLHYSEVVEDCREVYQNLDVYDIADTSNGTSTLANHRHLSNLFIIPSNLIGYIVWDNDYLIGLDQNHTHFVAWSLENGEIVWRMKPKFQRVQAGLTELSRLLTRGSVDRSVIREYIEDTDTRAVVIERVVTSGDHRILVVSCGLPYLCVFDLTKQSHVTNLDETYARTGTCQYLPITEGNAMSLEVATMSHSGQWFVHSEFNWEERTACLTIWSLAPIIGGGQKEDSTMPWYRRRLTEQGSVVAVRVEGGECMVAWARTNYGIAAWSPFWPEANQPQRLDQSERLEFSIAVPPLLELSSDGSKVAVASGTVRAQISVWYVQHSVNVLLGHIFSPKSAIGLRWVFREEFIAIRAEDQDRPLLIWPNWLTTKRQC
ncbi:unnamed protein product [Dicrocoelium dendriticum]|nr:unnamed protein product [Dicrocoelium dendriticum]